MGGMQSLIWSAGGSTVSDVYETEYGCIRGRSFDIGNGRRVNAFLGVPYAKPPIGELRFKAPQPPDEWVGVRDCVKQCPRAPQAGYRPGGFWGLTGCTSKSEDCLYLNIFAPEWNQQKDKRAKRAVLVWIHGGGYVRDSAASYGDLNICENLCSKDVIVVTVEFRLGILGFAATGDSNCTANLGLRDQAFALGWIQRNIGLFGGDPLNVTLFGHSSGGACVDLLALSPYSRDLFHKVIMMGGSANCAWALNEAAHVRDTLRDYARSLGWTTPEGSDGLKNASMMAFLKNQSVEALEVGIEGRPGFRASCYLRLDYTPVIDGDFLPEPIAELRRKTPTKFCMAGVTEYESLIFASKPSSSFSEEIDYVLETMITEEDHVNVEKLRTEARDLYLSESRSGLDVARAYIQMFSDIFITNGVYFAASEMLCAGHHVFLYDFEHFNKSHFGCAAWWMPFIGATHGTELPYIFGKGIKGSLRLSRNDWKILENFTTLFVDFAKFSDPNGEALRDLLPLERDNPWRYILVGETVTMKESFHGRRADFWRRLDDQMPIFLNHHSGYK